MSCSRAALISLEPVCAGPAGTKQGTPAVHSAGTVAQLPCGAASTLPGASLPQHKVSPREVLKWGRVLFLVGKIERPFVAGVCSRGDMHELVGA